MIRFYELRAAAYADMLAYNRAHPSGDPRVVVEGPEDNWAVMDLAEAIDGDFRYEWAA